ncbi:MAG: sigma-54 dependent transcriptional regulator [Bacteroidales bacterium]|nr:sigma-54-dependent Fis family transcriptional regulator [Bacteroidales bacterium]MBR3981279.1 sigma-54-dependent Fis family transcriptional regulator [Bacteroidales bacterium]MCR4799135.1 sigma-54 dependent transcriptional regulator [Bacteroidales bacterium]
MAAISILVVDDERAIRNSLKEILEYENYKVEVAENGADGLQKVQNGKFDLIFSDIKMPEMDGIAFLEAVLKERGDVPVIMMSGHAEIDTAVKSIKLGAYDFISKPLDMNRILVTVRNALDKKNLVQETAILKKKVGSKYQMIGNSEPLQKIQEIIGKVAPTDARVLITGPNGSGKELVARALHDQSNRKNAPFVEVNCAAIPSELIESELFGHEKGSFTSAIKTRIGKFEQADGGTLFLDEIGDMSLSAQAKVLRALQEQKITRVGSDKDISVDVRVLAATNKNMKEEIEAKRFREDLYHRLSVILIKVPSLAERIDDIPLLAEHFVNESCKEMGVPKKEISADAVKKLQTYPWTGNIREFRNVIERLVILSGKTIEASDVELYTQPLG